MFNKAKKVEAVVETVDQKVNSVINETDKLVEPVRRSAFRRFPALFILLTTFGVSATFYGFELLISKLQFLFDRPWLILMVGMVTLIGTGTLYKKLG